MRFVLVAFMISLPLLCGPAHAQPQGDASIIFGEVSRFTEAAAALNAMGYDAGPADAYGPASVAPSPRLQAAADAFRRARGLNDPRYADFSRDFLRALASAQALSHRKWIYDVQQLLNAMGYDAGPETGFMSDQTEAAAAAFRNAVNLSGGRRVDPELVATLSSYQSQGHRQGGPAPATTPALTSTANSLRDCAACPEMVVIPAGSFIMGSPESEEGHYADEAPQRRVSIASFAAGKFEVTFDEWDACADDGGCNGYRPSDQGWGRGSRPVINVDWNDAQAYVRWLSRETGATYRLLTEAEWEYAARAGTTSAYWWGGSASHEYANYGTDECCADRAEGRDMWLHTAPVGQFPANGFGLHDMHGNVMEWVEDLYSYNYADAPTDGRAVTSGSIVTRVMRGGAFGDSATVLRSAYRNRSHPTQRSESVGFRVARAL